MTRIELAVPGDARAIAPLFDAYRTFFTKRSELAASLDFLSARLANGESVVFVAWDDERACGFIQLYPLWSSWYCGRIWFLSDLFVAPEARRRGVGRLLVERVREYAHETQASSVMVELPLDEPHLRAFYANLAFHEDSVFALARYRPGAS